MPLFGKTTFPLIRVRAGPGAYVLLPVLTTTQRNALSAAEGYLIWNSTTTQVESYNGSSWVATGKLYGDALIATHLAASDPHSQYALDTDLALYLPLAGGALTGDVTVAALKTIDGVDISVHAANKNAHMTFTELAGGTDKQAGGAAAWEDWDISAIVPAGTLYALIDIRNASGTSQIIGVRKNGSALVRSMYLYNASQKTWLTEVDANRVVEIYVDSVTAGVYFNVLGYWS